MADASRRQDLCKLFNKFKKEELLHGLIEQGILEEGLLDTEGTKKAFVNRILKTCFAKEVTADNVGLMDLLCKFIQFLVLIFVFRQRWCEQSPRIHRGEVLNTKNITRMLFCFIYNIYQPTQGSLFSSPPSSFSGDNMTMLYYQFRKSSIYIYLQVKYKVRSLFLCSFPSYFQITRLIQVVRNGLCIN